MGTVLAFQCKIPGRDGAEIIQNRKRALERWRRESYRVFCIENRGKQDILPAYDKFFPDSPSDDVLAKFC